MSYDVFVQRFKDDDTPDMSVEAFDAVFGPCITVHEPEFSFYRITAPDGGEADIYAGMEPFDGMMVNRFDNGAVLDLLVEFARRSDAVIMPVDVPVLLTDINQQQHLPVEIRDNVRVVTTGADVQAAIQES